VQLGDATRNARTPHGRARFVGAFHDVLLRFAADGLPFDPGGLADDVQRAGRDPEEQALIDAIDETLSRLDAGPAVIELEGKLGRARRTVSRRASALHERYGLSGLAGVSWRSVRDFYRVLLGAILATHPRMTTRVLASTLGYGSAEALCHAFANAGLPSPGAIAKAKPRAA
jgi:hypothetical protein